MEAPNNIILPALILIPFIAGFICWLVDKLDQHLPLYRADWYVSDAGFDHRPLAVGYL